jgi:hypothetical protein
MVNNTPVYTGKRIIPVVRTTQELTNLKRIRNVEELFLQKLDELFNKNANIRYGLIRLFKSNNNNVTTTQIINQLRNWGIEIDYNIQDISIQRIIDYLK